MLPVETDNRDTNHLTENQQFSLLTVVFWIVTYSLVGGYWYFGGTLVTTYKTTWWHNPETTVNSYTIMRTSNLISNIIVSCLLNMPTHLIEVSQSFITNKLRYFNENKWETVKIVKMINFFLDIIHRHNFL
jgi:hypothetical protein